LALRGICPKALNRPWIRWVKLKLIEVDELRLALGRHGNDLF
jgi:hypothetical protein